MHRPGFIGPDRFGALLTLLLTMFILVPALQESRSGAVVLILFLALVLVAALTASGVRPRRVAIAGILTVVGVAITGTGTLLAEGATPAWVSGVSAAALAGTTMLVLRRILHHGEVTLRTVAGALCAYMMVGLAFGGLYRTVSVLDADAFTESLGGASTYFSFVTLTTLGYGDIAPVSDFARSLATLEAVIGQVLLVVLVARFVSTLGQPIRRPRLRQSDDAEGAGTE